MPITVSGIVHIRRLDTAESHWATKSVWGMISLRIGILAPLRSLAARAAERSVANPFPQDTVPPLLLDTWTGTSKPMTPATKSTALTAMINRRTVTFRPFPRRILLLL